MNKKKIIIAIWLLISVLMPILYLGIMRINEYNKNIKTYEKYKFIPDPIEKQTYGYQLKVKRNTLIDVLVITVFELVSITGLTIIIISKNRLSKTNNNISKIEQ